MVPPVNDDLIEPIVQVGAPVLRRRAVDVRPDQLGSDELARLYDRMRSALEETPGVGLAAPQIGVGLRVALVQDLPDYHAASTPAQLTERERELIEPYFLINPVLEVIGEEHRVFFEGCLSMTGYVGAVERALEIRVSYLDPTGRSCERQARGWHARILQHEVDHLDGTLYVDRLEPRTLCTAALFPEFYGTMGTEEAISAVASPV
jgi:peptide deformylase